MKAAVEVEGLRELTRSLKRVERELGGEIRRAFNRIVNPVMSEARAEWPRSDDSDHMADTIREGSTQAYAAVKAGGQEPGAFGFIEFGGKVGINESVSRPFDPEGRYLFPAAVRHERELAMEAERELGQLINRAGLD